jgi:hypothetical protein
MRCTASVIGLVSAALILQPAAATSLLFSTGDPNGLMASASRPGGGATFEIETADDFVLLSQSSITSATFTGLIPSQASVQDVVVEIYRVFPKDSDVARTSGPPTFSTTQVPTRVNSPSDVALVSRSGVTDLTFFTSTLQQSFTANNSVQPGGINPLPNVTTGGDGPVTGEEVEFGVNFITPLVLSADHYFFIPQVQLSDGTFLWLSSPRPISPPGTPFAPDLQGWARDQSLDPDWLRVGTDIVGAGTFNFAFSLSGDVVAVPLPSTLSLFTAGLAALSLVCWRRRNARRACA